MAEPIKVPIDEARQVARHVGADAVVIVAFRGDSFATTSFGKSKEICRAFSKVADHIHDDIAHGVTPIPDVLETGD